MKINIIENPTHTQKDAITDALWEHNADYHPVKIEQFSLEFVDESTLCGGLIAQTWWGALEVQYLWVAEARRGVGLGKSLMLQAEEIARERGCHMSYVDTFDFQAKGFYQKLGYEEYGSLKGYAHKFRRFYLAKELPGS
ncbi:GNAT family N-acetyltransferase [Erwinia amylovora]